MMTTSRTALLTATLLAASAPTAALARPTIVVGDAIPFSADDLANAVSIRADSTAEIRVTRDGDVLVVTVGDQARNVAVDPAIAPHDLARVVALVIVGLDAPVHAGAPVAPVAPIAPLPPGAPIAPTPPAPPPLPAPGEGSPSAAPGASGSLVLFGGGSRSLPPPKNWTLRASAGFEQMDSFRSQVFHASLSRRLGPSAHLVVGIGYDKHEIWTTNLDKVQVDAMPMKAGVELRHRWAAIEGGIAATRYYDSTCQLDAIATGGYASARAYLLPLGSIQNRVFLEAGIRHVVQGACTVDDFSGMALQNRDSAGHASLGLELPL